MRKLNLGIFGESNLSESMNEEYFFVKLYLVDLVGFECVKRIGFDGMRFKEG